MRLRTVLSILVVSTIFMVSATDRYVGDLVASLPSVVTADPVRQIPVLLYHHLEPGAGTENGAIISVEAFDSQMKWLHEKGYTTISTAELLDWLEGEAELSTRSVLITFDDGYESVYQYAYPTLKQYGFQAVVFVVTSSTGLSPGSKPHLTWEEMGEMAASGLVEIQGHSHDGHREVDGVPALIAWSTAEIQSDLQALNSSLAAHGLQPVTAYAYPYGAYDAEAVEALKTGGIRLMFTTRSGYVTKDADSSALVRMIVYPGTDLCQFARLVDPDGAAADPSCSGTDQ